MNFTNKNRYLILDDIRFNNMFEIWRSIKSPKLDITSIAHWSGTGIVDLSKNENVCDFHAKVDYANLKKLNFINDGVSVFKGDVVMKVAGSSINTMKGDIIITNASYQNPKNIYFFDDLTVNSTFDSNNEHTLSLYSPNEVNGKVQGKFELDQIMKMVQNSLGSLYTNYKPNVLKKGQYLKFN